MSQLFLKTKTTGYYMVQNANQLLYSQLFSNGVWTLVNGALTSGQTAPNSGTEAFRFTATSANATLLQSVVLTDGTLNRTFSIYIKRITGTGNISITVDGSTYSVESTSGTWARYDTTLAASGTVTAGIKITTSGDAVDIAWAQLEDGSASTYATNTANRYAVTQITDPDYPVNTTRGCAFLDGRFFVMTQSGDIYQSAIEDASSWGALDFIGAVVEPDEGKYLSRYNEYLFALKEFGAEFYYNADNDSGSILGPVQNAAFKVGCASDESVKEIAGTVIWMGQTRDGFGRGIFRLEGTAPKKISTPQVDKILNSDDLASVYSWAANVGSHMLYGLTLVTSGVTLVLDMSNEQWSFFTYLATSGSPGTITAITADGVATQAAHGYSDGDIIKVSSTNSDFDGWHIAMDVTTNTYQLQDTGTAFSGSGVAQKHTEAYFPIIASTAANGVQYMQHATTGVLYEFAQDVYTDSIGAIACRIRTPKFDSGSAKFKSMKMAELIGDKISSVAGLRHTDDDFVTYSGFRPVDLSIERSWVWRLGRFSRRSFEILHVKNALLRLEALEIEGS